MKALEASKARKRHVGRGEMAGDLLGEILQARSLAEESRRRIADLERNYDAAIRVAREKDRELREARMLLAAQGVRRRTRARAKAGFAGVPVSLEEAARRVAAAFLRDHEAAEHKDPLPDCLACRAEAISR